MQLFTVTKEEHDSLFLFFLYGKLLEGKELSFNKIPATKSVCVIVDCVRCPLWTLLRNNDLWIGHFYYNWWLITFYSFSILMLPLTTFLLLRLLLTFHCSLSLSILCWLFYSNCNKNVQFLIPCPYFDSVPFYWNGKSRGNRNILNRVRIDRMESWFGSKVVRMKDSIERREWEGERMKTFRRESAILDTKF